MAAITNRGYSRMRWTGQIFWLLASDACAASHLLPAFTSETFRGLAQWEVVSSYSSATAPEFHGISCADPLFQARKELGPRTSGLHFKGQDYLISELTESFCVLDRASIKPHRHWRSRLHRIHSHACAAGKISGRASYRNRRLSLR